jgi:uncharacterized protein (TIGR00255 family)
MISSMTGFGRGHAEGDGLTTTVELKSVNSRFCEISVRGPRSIAEKEVELQNRIKQSVSRGRITVHVMIEPEGGSSDTGGINLAAAESYRGLLEDLIRDLALQDTVRLDHVLRFPDVFQKEESSDPEIGVIWPVTAAALETALDNLCRMRRKEGEALRTDLTKRLDAIEKDLVVVNERAPDRVSAARTRLQERIAELVGEDRLDRERLEFEIAILSDKLDVNEEAVRLASHIQLFREALGSEEPVGRKLNFIAQEINREINTIGSKANDSELSHVVVRMKEELEKIREQIENVE